MAKRKNVYTHEIELKDLRINNRPREQFRKLLEEVKYRGYEVENLRDGRKIVVTKPGGKFTFGTIKREDFMVWVCNPHDSTLWLISHTDIKNDLVEKGKDNPAETIEVFKMLERVYLGEEPDLVLKQHRLTGALPGEPADLLLKAYKWIWGQEDSNYPDGKGRAMSWEGWRKEGGRWVKIGDGLVDVRDKLISDLQSKAE